MMTAVILLLNTILTIALWIIIIQIIMSWLINFNVINLYQPLVRQIWDALNAITAPVYRPIRKFIPPMGGLDFAPLILILAIYFLRDLLRYDLAPALLG